MNSKARFVPDAAYCLRTKDAAAITTDTAILGGELVSPINAGAVWNAEVKDGLVAIKILASALDATTGDETYNVQVITSAASNLGTPTVHETKAMKAGVNELLIDQEVLLAAAPTHKYWGLNIDVGGTTPSGKFEIYVLPDSGRG